MARFSRFSQKDKGSISDTNMRPTLSIHPLDLSEMRVRVIEPYTMSPESKPTAEPTIELPIDSTDLPSLSVENSDADAWLEDLLLAGVHASVKPSLSSDPISMPAIAEHPLPSWVDAENSSLEMETPPEKIAQSTKIVLDEANRIEEPSDSSVEETGLDVEMNHLLSNDIVDTKPAEELDQLVDSIFHGLNTEPEPESIAPEADADELLPEPIDEYTNEEIPSDNPIEELPSDAECLEPSGVETAQEVTSEPENEISPAEIDPVAAEIAKAMKLVEAEVAEEGITADEPVTKSILDPEEPQPVAVTEEEPAAKAAEAPDAMTQEAIHSLLAKFDDSDVPMPISAPKEPGTKASCPAGSPQPKINLAALKKVKPGGEEPPALAARLFGGDTLEGGGKDEVPEHLSGEEAPSLTPLVMDGKQLPAVLLALDGLTDRLRNIHSLLPIALGGLGAFLFVNGLLTIVLASLGWI